jgi:hypothetical protein
MPKYTLEYEGKTYDIESDEPLSDEQLLSYVGAPAGKWSDLPGNIGPDIPRQMGNLGRTVTSLAKLAGEGARRVIHPHYAIEQFQNTAKAAPQMLQELSQVPGQVAESLRPANLKQSIIREPIGALMNVAALATGGGAAATAAKLPRLGRILTKVGAATDPVQLAAKGVSSFLPSQEGMQNFAGRLWQSANKLTEKEDLANVDLAKNAAMLGITDTPSNAKAMQALSDERARQVGVATQAGVTVPVGAITRPLERAQRAMPSHEITPGPYQRALESQVREIVEPRTVQVGTTMQPQTVTSRILGPNGQPVQTVQQVPVPVMGQPDIPIDDLDRMVSRINKRRDFAKKNQLSANQEMGPKAEADDLTGERMAVTRNALVQAANPGARPFNEVMREFGTRVGAAKAMRRGAKLEANRNIVNTLRNYAGAALGSSLGAAAGGFGQGGLMGGAMGGLIGGALGHHLDNPLVKMRLAARMARMSTAQPSTAGAVNAVMPSVLPLSQLMTLMASHERQP